MIIDADHDAGVLNGEIRHEAFSIAAWASHPPIGNDSQNVHTVCEATIAQFECRGLTACTFENVIWTALHEPIAPASPALTAVAQRDKSKSTTRLAPKPKNFACFDLCRTFINLAEVPKFAHQTTLNAVQWTCATLSTASFSSPSRLVGVNQ